MRNPAVAGQFYTSNALELKKEIEMYLKKAGMKKGNAKNIVAGVSPHAGYMYSGWIAGHTFAEIAANYSDPPTFVIVGPNHTGMGAPVALSLEDWRTPLGTAKCDVELGKAITEKASAVLVDESAHKYEHSIEVQLPFLQTIYKDFRFVAICMGAQNASNAEAVGKAVFEAGKEIGREVFLLASSDFTHYEPAEKAKAKDSEAIKCLEKLDYRSFIKIIDEKNYSICGYGPIATAAVYAKLMGASKAEVLKYASSGDIIGDYSSVVAYASIVFRKR